MSAKMMSWAVVAVVSAVSVCGCGVFPGTDRPGLAGEKKLSHDGSLEARVRGTERLNWSVWDLSDFWRMDEQIWVAWGAPGGGRDHKLRVVRVPHDERSGTYPVVYDTHLYFSPDSRRLAVVSHANLLIVDLITGAHSTLTAGGERVSSLAWVSNSEIVYASHTYTWAPTHDSIVQSVSDRAFWRQSVDQGPGLRRLLYRESGLVAGANRNFPWPLESFSPTGAHVIFRSPNNGNFLLLDTAGRSVRTIGPCTSGSAVWWNADGSRAICSMAAADRYLSIDPAAGRVMDVSAKVASMIQRERRWRRDATYDNYAEIQTGAVNAVLSAPVVVEPPPAVRAVAPLPFAYR